MSGRVLQLSESAGPETNTKLAAWDCTFEKLVDRFSKRPRVGRKEGRYFLRGPFKEEHPTRSDEHILKCCLVILDGDSTVDQETGEITDGAPHPELVHQALKSLGVTHFIFTTWSHGSAGKGHRYRVALPADVADPQELAACVDWLLEQLHAQDTLLAPVVENYRWSQPWYTPRLSSEDSEFLTYEYCDGVELDVPGCVEWNAKQEPLTDDRLSAAANLVPQRNPDSVFAQYNAKHGGADAMLALLEHHGYQKKSAGKINGETSWRLLAPGSTSNTAGVALFKSKRGDWYVYSHHGSHDPLSGPGGNKFPRDAFDVFRILEHKGEQKAALAAWRAEVDPRPVVRIHGGALNKNVKAVIQAIASCDPPTVFQRGQTLCRVAHVDALSGAHGSAIPRGAAAIVELRKNDLLVHLSKVARWEKWSASKEDWTDADPCPKVNGAILELVGAWDGIPGLLGISEAPILRDDGRLHSVPGYDRATGLYVEGRIPEIDLPASPTLEDAQTATEYLLHPFKEFPFVDFKLDQSVLLAYLITLALRPQLDTAPLFCVSATTPGSGKGLLIEIANLLVRGRDAALMPAIGGNSAEEEMRKRITALLSQGVASINLDNWTHPIGGESMNALMTATEWTDRILGRSEAVTLPARTTLAATGNNLTVRGDMTRRALLLQLDPGHERPELRKFKVPNLARYVLQHRGDLLKALFTVLRAYQVAGSPAGAQPLLGRFECWGGAVSGLIRWLGLPDPIASQERLRAKDPEAERLETLLVAWFDMHGQDWVTAKDLIGLSAFPFGGASATNELHRQALVDAVEGVASGKGGIVCARVLGWYLGKFEGRIAAGYRLQKRGRTTGSKSAHQYRVDKVSDLSSVA